MNKTIEFFNQKQKYQKATFKENVQHELSEHSFNPKIKHNYVHLCKYFDTLH